MAAHRIGVEFGDEAHEYLEDYARRKNCTAKEALRRALGIMKFVEEAQAGPGSGMLVERAGTLREVVFLV